MLKNIKKIQLIFCKHDFGKLACVNKIQNQPPLGLVTIATHLESIFPDFQIEVLDGKNFELNELYDLINADVVGFSTWFSNYKSTVSLIKKIKMKNPSTKIVVGGPHATVLAKNVMQNNSNIDYVIVGEGEIKLQLLLSGISPCLIPGIYYRKDGLVNYTPNSEAMSIDLDLIPYPNLDVLSPKYEWNSTPQGPAMSAFPISGIRGCFQKKRCDYCSIPFLGLRTMSPNRYWDMVNILNEKYKIDFFFETGDVFPVKFLKQLSEYSDIPDIKFRIYAYPNAIKKRDMELLKKIGVNTIFIGVESILIWSKNVNRRYSNNYSLEHLIQEITELGQLGIKVIPSFILGLPGENHSSLEKNVELILKLRDLKNVDEITVSSLLVLPGTKYYNDFISDINLRDQYNKAAGKDLLQEDIIDFKLMSKYFMNEYTKIGYEKIDEKLSEIEPFLGDGFACWSKM